MMEEYGPALALPSSERRGEAMKTILFTAFVLLSGEALAIKANGYFVEGIIGRGKSCPGAVMAAVQEKDSICQNMKSRYVCGNFEMLKTKIRKNKEGKTYCAVLGRAPYKAKKANKLIR